MITHIYYFVTLVINDYNKISMSKNEVINQSIKIATGDSKYIFLDSNIIKK